VTKRIYKLNDASLLEEKWSLFVQSEHGSLKFFPHDGFTVLGVDCVFDVLVHFNL